MVTRKKSDDQAGAATGGKVGVAPAPASKKAARKRSAAVSETPAAPSPAPGAAAPALPPEPAQVADEEHQRIERTLVHTIIALPLHDKLCAERAAGAPAQLHEVIIDLHLGYPEGRKAAGDWVRDTLQKLIEAHPSPPGQRLHKEKNRFTEQYVFARLSSDVIQRLVLLDAEPKPGLSPVVPHTVGPHAIYQIWEDFKIKPLIFKSYATMKCNAARASFAAAGENVVWGVIDSGIQGDHPHFVRHGNLKGAVESWHCDFTGEDAPLQDGFGHGTHVAGIIAGEIPARPGSDDGQPADHPDIVAYTRVLKQDGEDREVVPERIQLPKICGMAPMTKLVSLKVIDAKEQGAVSNIIAAIAHVQEINAYGRHLRIHGVNLSVGYPFDPEWFACGQSQLCVEVDRLVRSGVVVVVAAGNTGYGVLDTEFRGRRRGGLALSINDPGNAEGAITVGSTHRDMPHVYGVSYFSSKGPTGDGRLKPDLVAPGERIISCAAGALKARIQQKLGNGAQQPTYIESTGTSMAAPHVSGAAAALLSVKQEFIGQPERVKAIFMSTATDLQRERQFQGAGLIDLMRAIQSV